MAPVWLLPSGSMTGPDPATIALHADRDVADLPDVAPPLRPSTTFDRSAGGRTYRRDSHETTERLEAVLGALEGGHCVAYPSGMAAIAAVLRRLAPSRVSLPEDVYHGTRAFVTAEAGSGRWQLVPPDQLEAGDVRWLETPSNPKCLVSDLRGIAAAMGERDVLTIVDSTFATPILQRPLDHGCEVVVHATTKFIAGHSDAMGGVAVARRPEVADSLRAARARDGAIPGALDSWLTLRGVRTLALRVRHQSAAAHDVARRLAALGLTVWYPGLAAHPGHAVAAAQMSGFGGVLSFEVSTAETASRIVGRLELFRVATSLGGVESLAEHRIEADPSAPPGLIRLSIGLEGTDDLWADLEQAIRAG